MPYAKPNEAQHTLFGEREPWRDEWVGMPEFEQRNLLPIASVRVNFASYEDMKKFAEMIGQTITTKTDSVWYPPQEKAIMFDKRYIDEA